MSRPFAQAQCLLAQGKYNAPVTTLTGFVLHSSTLDECLRHLTSYCPDPYNTTVAQGLESNVEQKL